MKKINELINPNNFNKNSFFEFNLKKDFQQIINNKFKVNILDKDIQIKDKVILLKNNNKLKPRILLTKEEILNNFNNLIRDIR
ncbi:MAG: hypothetical protein Q7T49_01350 [bacterium]|nr:hypothetical protein [bacterium]